MIFWSKHKGRCQHCKEYTDGSCWFVRYLWKIPFLSRIECSYCLTKGWLVGQLPEAKFDAEKYRSAP